MSLHRSRDRIVVIIFHSYLTYDMEGSCVRIAVSAFIFYFSSAPASFFHLYISPAEGWSVPSNSPPPNRELETSLFGRGEFIGAETTSTLSSYS